MKLVGMAQGRAKAIRRILSAVLMAGLVAATAVTFYQYHHNRAIEETRGAAAEAATDSVSKLLSYHADTVDADLKQSMDLVTGAFADDYKKLTEETVAPASKEKKISTEANAVATGVTEASDDRASVLAFVNQSTTSSESPEPTTSASQVRLEMTLVDGRWLISGLEPI